MTRAGAWLWIATLQLFVAELITALAWPTSYSVANDTISALGLVGCHPGACSPLHPLFNISIGLSGILTAVGAVLLRTAFARPRLAVAAAVSFVIGGICVSLVGAFPADSNVDAHSLVAVLQWVFQLAGMILIAVAARGQRAIRVVAVVAAAVSLVGFVAFVSEASPHGILERIAFDTLTWFQVVTGILVLRSRRQRAPE